MTEGLSDELRELLGTAGFIALVEAFGGTRLYVPHTIHADHEIASAIGDEGARLLSRRYAPSVLRIPLARECRALHYRAQGLSNAQIARKLGIGESGVDKLMRRNRERASQSSQLPLFEA